MSDFNKKSGQALVEFLPSMVLFLMVITAGLSYFRTMREATIRQEVVRNLAFAKISNSGTLTTPLSQSLGGSLLFEGSPQVTNVEAIPAGQNEGVFVGPGGNPPCFTVTPEQVQKTLTPGDVVGVGRLNPVTITTYAVVHRYPGGNCP